MTPEEKRAAVERLGPWFHRIDLGDGVVTKGRSVAGEADDHPRPTWAVVSKALPGDLSGLSILDVGCNAGFYSVEAKRRGAARVVGVDAQRHEVRQASFVARALGLPIEFRRMSVYDLSPETVGVFDVTLALGLVYHLKHLVLGLERLHSVTRSLLVLETAVLLPELVPTRPVPYVTGPLSRSLHPIGYVENSPDAKEAVFNWFVPSVGAMQAMLADCGFDDVRCVATPGDRAVFVCTKREGGSVRILPDLASRLEVASSPGSCRLGEAVTFAVKATNTGRSAWSAGGEDDEGKGRVALGAHLFRGGEEVEWSWARQPLPSDVPPGGSVELTLGAVAPLLPGRFRVELDLVAEHLAWFEDLGSPLLEVGLEVTPEEAPMLWYRVFGIEEGIAKRGNGRLEARTWRTLLNAATAELGALSAAEQALAAFLWTHGWRPDETEVDGLAASLRAREDGLAGTLHALALRPDPRPVPHEPPAERAAALVARAPSRAETGTAFAGESFPGEAVVAQGLLAEGAGLGDEDFVNRAYEAVLGRPADEGGLASAADGLASGSLTRTHLLHELLWSAELRSA